MHVVKVLQNICKYAGGNTLLNNKLWRV